MSAEQGFGGAAILLTLVAALALAADATRLSIGATWGAMTAWAVVLALLLFGGAR